MRSSEAHNRYRIPWTGLLGLAQMELTFFIAACMVLCFGLVAKTALAPH